jgi:hypothetical protein
MIQSLNQRNKCKVTLSLSLGTIAVSNAANTNTFGGDKKVLVWGDNLKVQ